MNGNMNTKMSRQEKTHRIHVTKKKKNEENNIRTLVASNVEQCVSV